MPINTRMQVGFLIHKRCICILTCSSLIKVKITCIDSASASKHVRSLYSTYALGDFVVCNTRGIVNY